MISRTRRPSTPDPRSRSPCDLPGDLEAKRDALATVLATTVGVEPSAVALSIDGATISADITVPAEDADATRALLSALITLGRGPFAGAAKSKPKKAEAEAAEAEAKARAAAKARAEAEAEAKAIICGRSPTTSMRTTRLCTTGHGPGEGRGPCISRTAEGRGAGHTMVTLGG